jgi:hypothetical protein
MVNIRQATPHDLLHMQMTNLWCLPENYQVNITLQDICDSKQQSKRPNVLIVMIINYVSFSFFTLSDEILLLSSFELAPAFVGSRRF